MASLCHPWFTTTNVSYRFPILKRPPPPCAVLLVDTCIKYSVTEHFYILYGRKYYTYVCVYIYVLVRSCKRMQITDVSHCANVKNMVTSTFVVHFHVTKLPVFERAWVETTRLRCAMAKNKAKSNPWSNENPKHHEFLKIPTNMRVFLIFCLPQRNPSNLTLTQVALGLSPTHPCDSISISSGSSSLLFAIFHYIIHVPSTSLVIIIVHLWPLVHCSLKHDEFMFHEFRHILIYSPSFSWHFMALLDFLVNWWFPDIYPKIIHGPFSWYFPL